MKAPIMTMRQQEIYEHAINTLAELALDVVLGKYPEMDSGPGGALAAKVISQFRTPIGLAFEKAVDTRCAVDTPSR